MAKNKEKSGGGFMNRLATFIVDKRSLFFLITIIMLNSLPFHETG